VRANYTALNYIITSSEAIICKRWMVEVYDELCARFRYGWDGDVLITLWIHDELVTCCRPEIADQVGEIMVRHARKAGEFYNFRVPLDAEYKIGRSWAGDARDGDNKPTIELIRPEEGADGDGPDETTDTIIPPREEQPQQDQVVHLRQWSHEAIPPTALPPRSTTLGQKAASENVAEEPKSNGLGGNGRIDIRVNSGGVPSLLSSVPRRLIAQRLAAHLSRSRSRTTTAVQSGPHSMRPAVGNPYQFRAGPKGHGKRIGPSSIMIRRAILME